MSGMSHIASFPGCVRAAWPPGEEDTPSTHSYTCCKYKGGDSNMLLACSGLPNDNIIFSPN